MTEKVKRPSLDELSKQAVAFTTPKIDARAEIVEMFECPECLTLCEDSDEAAEHCPPDILSKLVCSVCNESVYAHLKNADEKMNEHLKIHLPDEADELGELLRNGATWEQIETAKHDVKTMTPEYRKVLEIVGL